jgi:hypothetical protein
MPFPFRLLCELRERLEKNSRMLPNIDSDHDRDTHTKRNQFHPWLNKDEMDESQRSIGADISRRSTILTKAAIGVE